MLLADVALAFGLLFQEANGPGSWWVFVNGPGSWWANPVATFHVIATHHECGTRRRRKVDSNDGDPYDRSQMDASVVNSCTDTRMLFTQLVKPCCACLLPLRNCLSRWPHACEKAKVHTGDSLAKCGQHEVRCN